MRVRLRVQTKVCRFGREERGTQLVELAIVLPLLVVLFASVAEFGRYLYTYTTLAKATRSGARYLATAQDTADEDARTKNLVVYGNFGGTGDPLLDGLTTGNVSVTRQAATPTSGGTVKVKIDGYVFRPLFDLGALTGRKDFSLRVSVAPATTMRYLLTQPFF
ncbi:MAG: hypothetical protein QOJ76_2845 [Acidobacteriota bacterium]|jgi:Flp pilus assembly protein TadG|nr:hypothetical protein [Acidobacteriota bacterium]